MKKSFKKNEKYPEKKINNKIKKIKPYCRSKQEEKTEINENGNSSRARGREKKIVRKISRDVG